MRRVAVVSIKLADLLAARPLYSAWRGAFPPRAISFDDLRRIARQLREAHDLARLRWHVAVEWQILAHSVRNCTSAADARYAIELRAQTD